MPGIPPAHVPRQRLLDRLTAGSRAQLIAVIGPAGSGKTVLASSWAQAGQAPGPVSWLTLDEEDNAPGVFWSYVLHAIRRNAPAVGGDLVAPARANAVDRSFLAQLAAQLAELPRPVVLVLDRCEVITNRAIGADLDLLVRYSTPGLRVIVVGRSARLLPLHRYRLIGDLTEIGANDLALLPGEAAAVLARHGVHVSDEESVALHDSMEGWVTGVSLHALARRCCGAGPPGAAHPASHHTVADYLRTEVLDQQVPRGRDLLLRTSIVDLVHPDLADRLTGRCDASQILGELVRANAFVRPDGPGWYRYHRLFRKVLRDELTARHSDLVRRLHARAARWYAEQNLLEDALRHAAQAGDWGFAAGLVVDRFGVAYLLAAPGAGALRPILDAMPAGQPGPHAALVRAVLALGRFDTTAARVAVEAAYQMSVPTPQGGAVPLRVASAAIRVILARHLGDLDTAEHAAAELDTLWPLLSPVEAARQAALPALVLASLGVVQLWAGHRDSARASLDRAAATAEPGSQYAAHDALAHLALLELTEGNLHRAEKYALESLAVADRAGLSAAGRVGAASAVLAAIALLWNDVPAVRGHVSRAIQSPGARHDPPTATTMALLRARVAIGRGDGRRAMAAIDAVRAAMHGWGASDAVAEQVSLTTAAAHLALQDPAAARACLDSVPDTAERVVALAHVLAAEGEPARARQILADVPRSACLRTLQHAALLQAQLALAGGDEETAVRALGEALECARPEQRRRPFAEAGAWVRQLLTRHPELAAQHTWLSQRMREPERMLEGAAASAEPLTEREVEVLERLAQGLSTGDIASNLHVSVNTVKTHLKHIYRKLGTTRRSATARRARELKLVGEA